jgi:Mg2+-importing ATPase
MRKSRVVNRKKAAGRRPAAIRNAEAITNFGALHSDISNIFDAYGGTASGLSAEEARRRLDEHGPNSVVHDKTAHWWTHVAGAFSNAFILLLLALAAIAALTKDIEAAAIISVMVLVSAILRFTQEFRSNKAAEKLHDLVQTTATVTRDGVKTEIAVDELAPGDLVHVSAGDMIPADLRLASAKDLFVSQSALTGESLPVEKFAVESGDSGNPLDHPGRCFMGTNVISGTGTGLVVRTGASTAFGSLARTVMGRRVETEFDRGVSRVSRLLIRFTVFMVPIVFFINGFTKNDWERRSSLRFPLRSA